MNLFFARELSEKAGSLSEEESHHASRVLRMQPGDRLYVTQGRGFIYEAELRETGRKEATFEVTGLYRKEEKQRHTHIAIAPTKSNDRFENFLEKATELGVDEISPIICGHSERKVYKTARGQKIITAAAKQSLSAWWPVLHEPRPLQGFLQQQAPGPAPEKFIAWCGEEESANILPRLPQYPRMIMLVGPEGDFSPEEVKLARAAGYQSVSLGPRRLRTETAGMAVAMAHTLL